MKQSKLEEAEQMVLDLDKRFGPGPSIEKWYAFLEEIEPVFKELGRPTMIQTPGQNGWTIISFEDDGGNSDRITARIEELWTTLLPRNKFSMLDLLKYHWLQTGDTNETI